MVWAGDLGGLSVGMSRRKGDGREETIVEQVVVDALCDARESGLLVGNGEGFRRSGRACSSSSVGGEAGEAGVGRVESGRGEILGL